ncbi:MAG TPA: TPM domain-containing protein [Pseudolabrys sp.]|jgi:putative membrane protein|nr:TPM domain-containing protein [Pseudolabrys sp.]
MTISNEDHERITNAIRSAEEKTSGEIVCVLARVSSHATVFPVFIAAMVALVTPWLLVGFTAMPVLRILSVQVILFVVLLTILCIPAVRVALVPRRARRAIAYRVAMEQFINRGIARNADRCGILIFVSLAERYARIIADDEIAKRVPQSRWQAAVDALIAHAREDRVGDGFIAAIELCGKELAQHFPPKHDSRGKLPDRLYVI